jgi:hypothetical protein
MNDPENTPKQAGGPESAQRSHPRTPAQIAADAMEREKAHGPDRRKTWKALAWIVCLIAVAMLAIHGCGGAGSGPHPSIERREAKEHEERVVGTFCLESGSREGALQKGGKNAEETYEIACE